MKTKEELITAWKNAWSIESRNIEEDPGDLEVVGKFKSRDASRGYIIYRSASGLYWYKTVFQGERGIIGEEEHIFGKKRTSRRGNMSHVPRRL